MRIIIVVMISAVLTACGKSDEIITEPLEEAAVEKNEADSEVIEEVAEEEPVEDIEENNNEKEDILYARLYLGLIKELYLSNQADQFLLVNVDSDGIPELVVTSSADLMREYSALYTIYDEDTKLIVSDETYADGIYIAFYEGKSVIETGSGFMGEHIQDSELREGELELIFKSEAVWIPVEDSEEEFGYYINEEKVSEDEYNTEIRRFRVKYNDCKAIEYDGIQSITIDENGQEQKGEKIPYMSYKDITNELKKMIQVNDTKSDAEPWEVSYRNCLYDIYLKEINVVDRSEDYSDEMIFTLYDLFGDGVPELLVSNRITNEAPYWNVFDYDGNNTKQIGYMSFYDTENKTVYDYAGEYFWLSYYLYDIQNGEFIITKEMSYRDIYDAPDVTPEDVEYECLFYDRNGKVEKKEVMTEDDWNTFVEEYKAGIEKYGIKDYVELTSKNIDIRLGFKSGSYDESDNSLYEVEVTAPDGYVNFRMGAGADYESFLRYQMERYCQSFRMMVSGYR